MGAKVRLAAIVIILVLYYLIYVRLMNRSEVIMKVKYEDDETTPAKTGTSAKKISTGLDSNSVPHLLTEGKYNPSRPLLKSTATSYNSTTSSVIEKTSDWIKGTFCYNYFVDTFQLPIPVCAGGINTSLQTSIKCFGTPYSDEMATCTLENIIISPRTFGKTMIDADHKYMEYNKAELSIALLDGCGTECHNANIKLLKHQVHYFDYVLQVVARVKEAEPQPAAICEKWIEDDIFFFTAQRAHIYLRFLDYFNVHKLLQDSSQSRGIQIIRISGSENYLFPEFDEALFPEAKVHTVDSLKDVKTCFKKVILVPKGVHSFPFRCKMSLKTVQKCLDCNGLGLSKTQLNSFRRRVLQACSVSDKKSNNITQKSVPSIIYESRKPYLRYKGDNLNRFQRVLTNEKELVTELRKALQPATVRQVHLEDLGLCEQVRIVHDADIYIGVHGAGLVHLWWLREDALVYEMEPLNMHSNPTFRTLAHLSGRKYKSSSITGAITKIKVNIHVIVKDLKEYLNL